MKLLWIGVVVLAACGGGGGKAIEDAPAGPIDAPPDVAVHVDASTDAAIDAPILVDAAVDAPVILIDAMVDAASGPCNPLAQTGCNSGERCTWIKDQDVPTPIGHIGCVPMGTVAVGAACTVATATTGHDDCIVGSVCVSGTCKQICDLQGGTPTCGTNFACTQYQGLFDSGGTTVAGVCDVKCDPLTQVAATGSPTAACGSTTPTSPNQGCYGFDEFSCATVLANALTLTDRTIPPQFVTNACAPGFMPLLYADTGSMTATCNGLCAALETDNTPAHVNNSKGDPAALGKLPTAAAPVAGDATCAIGKKGSEATSDCRFLWIYLVDINGDVPATFLPYADTLGVCFARAHYKYDSNNDGQLTAADLTQPDCNTLPPRSAATTGAYDDAADFGCQKIIHSMFTAAPVGPSAAPWTLGVVPVVRHQLRW